MEGDLLTRWPDFVEAAVAAIDAEWETCEALCRWHKDADGSLVTNVDLRIDIAIRTTLWIYYPEVAVLSEELGWLHPTAMTPASMVAIIDPIDGTESLVARHNSWWTAIALVERGIPRAGVVHQPTTGITHDSATPRHRDSVLNVVGLSPDQIDAPETHALRHHLEQQHFSVQPVPHAVEKVAAVLEGRCDACVYLPTDKSPGWRSWDLAACVAVASTNDIVLRAADGSAAPLDELETYSQVPWICASSLRTLELVQAAISSG